MRPAIATGLDTQSYLLQDEKSLAEANLDSRVTSSIFTAPNSPPTPISPSHPGA
jgi:hypothetical protein